MAAGYDGDESFTQEITVIFQSSPHSRHHSDFFIRKRTTPHSSRSGVGIRGSSLKSSSTENQAPNGFGVDKHFSIFMALPFIRCI